MADRRILVVDDEATVCDIMAMILEDAGYSVDKATGGLEALARIQRKRPSLIILDLMMPGVSGWDVYDALQANKRTRNIPIVVISADRDVLARAQELGVAAHIGKPFQLDDFVRVVEENLPRGARPRDMSYHRCQGVA